MSTAAVENPHGASIRTMVPDGYYLVSDAALLVGKSADTLRRWQHDGIYEPESYMMVGSLRVRLYSERDIAEMKKIAKSIRPGRKPTL